MEIKNSKNENPEPAFPEENSLVIQAILEKYELNEKQQEGIEKMSIAKNVRELKEIMESLPGTKIAKLVKQYGEGKVSSAEIPFCLSQELNIPEKKAEEIAKELKDTLLVLIDAQREKIKEKEILPSKIPQPEIKPSIVLPKIPPKKDIYREPIE